MKQRELLQKLRELDEKIEQLADESAETAYRAGLLNAMWAIDEEGRHALATNRDAIPGLQIALKAIKRLMELREDDE